MDTWMEVTKLGHTNSKVTKGAESVPTDVLRIPFNDLNHLRV